MKQTALFSIIAICVTLFAALPTEARAEQARAYLVFGTNEPSAPDPALAEFEPSLKQLFGYKCYQLLSSDAAELRGTEPITLTFERGMSLRVVPLGTERNVRHVGVTVHKGPRVLADTTMRMAGGAPVIFRLLEKENGLLIIILVVR
jgi:hypothetical protein